MVQAFCMKNQGAAGPNEACDLSGEVDANRHALFGHGKSGQGKTTQRLKCQACETTFGCRKRTPLYYIKHEVFGVQEHKRVFAKY
jgi:transposase-like protein